MHRLHLFRLPRWGRRALVALVLLVAGWLVGSLAAVYALIRRPYAPFARARGGTLMDTILARRYRRMRSLVDNGTLKIGGGFFLAVALALGVGAGDDLGPPEVGHGLTAKEAAAGWISLFDGQTTFGWRDARVDGDRLVGGTTTTAFGNGELRAVVDRPGTITVGGTAITVRAGPWTLAETRSTGPIRLGPGTAVRRLVYRPHGLKPLFNGRDLDGWKRVDHPTLPATKRPTWAVAGGALRATGGPGALEYAGAEFGDFVLQADVRTRAAHANGGVFFRCQPGRFMLGYEAQIHNRCEGNDPGRPARYATGGIDDRQNARRLVSRDFVSFRLTVLAHGPHLATWVNGHQVTDWTDDRPASSNPRQGLRTAAGTLQLQAHDAATDLEILSVGVAELGDRERGRE